MGARAKVLSKDEGGDVGVRLRGARVVVAAAACALLLAGCDKATILVSVVNTCGAIVPVLVSDAEHQSDHMATNFRKVSDGESIVFVVPVAPDGDISLMTYDATIESQQTRVVSLAKEAVDGTTDDGRPVRVLTLQGTDCPATE